MKINISKIERFKVGQFSIKDYMSVKKYFSDNNYHTDLEESAKTDWNARIDKDIKEKDLEPILHKIHHKIRMNENLEKNIILKLYQSFSKIAALLLLPALLTIVFLSYFLASDTKEVISWAEIHSPAAARTHFVLPDGSEGWLNSNSSIKYQVDFKKNRKVELMGEAWFDVEHDNGKGFLVQTSHFDVNVLGTRFNVLSYEGEETTEVILEEGKVLVTGKNNSFSRNLEPDQHFEYNKSGSNFTVKGVDAKAYTAWKDGLIISRNQPMSELVRRLGRRYNADIILHGDELKELVLRATFEDESLEDILKLISVSEPIKYKFHKRYKQENDTYSKTKVEIWLTKSN